MMSIDSRIINNPRFLMNAGYEALIDKLGTVGAALFIQQFEPGAGDYTKERVNLCNESSIEEFEKNFFEWKSAVRNDDVIKPQ